MKVFFSCIVFGIMIKVYFTNRLAFTVRKNIGITGGLFIQRFNYAQTIFFKESFWLERHFSLV